MRNLSFLDNKFKMEEQSAPIFKGLFGGSKVRGSIDVDIAKSALQKAIRRGNFKLAFAMGIRLNEFLDLEEGKGKAIRTNLINRLPVIAGEDVGMGNLWVVDKVKEYVEKYFHPGKERYTEKLIECIGWMVLSEKSRLGSYINAVFYQALCSPQYYPRLEELYPGLLNRMKEIEKRSENTPDMAKYSDLDNRPVDSSDAVLLDRIFYLLKNAKDDHEKMATFFYIRLLYNSKNKYKIKRGKTMRKISSEPIYFVWNKMLEMNKDTVLVSLYEQFLNENERHIYLVLGMMVFYFGGQVERKKLDVKDLIDQSGGYENIIKESFEDTIEIPEYVVDKHTKKGRSKGKDSVVFAVEGALVENESEWSKKWSFLQDIYVDFRKYCPSFTLENSFEDIVSIWTGCEKKEVEVCSEFDFLVSGRIGKEKRLSIMSDDTIRGQLLTSSWKKYVYIPTDENFVYKGPFDPIHGSPKEREKVKTLKFRFEVCRHFKSKVLKGDILIDDKNHLWVKYPSLSSTEPEEWKTTVTFDKTSGKNIKVIDRKSMGILPVSYYSHEKDKIKRYMFGNRGCGLYYDFLLLYVIGVGDTGLYNVLTAGLAPMIIDIDDDTTKTEFTKDWSIFGKAPAPSVVEVVVEGVKENKSKILTYLQVLKDGIPKIKNLAIMYDMKNSNLFEKKVDQLIEYFSEK
jgi:hypothetical protein